MPARWTQRPNLCGFGNHLGCLLDVADWVAAQTVAVKPIAATMALLPRLRPDVVSAVLTNNNLLVKQHFATLYPEVAALVADQAYVSAEFGMRKPDPAVYRRCLVRMRVEATLFVDDSPDNVAGARAAGPSHPVHTRRISCPTAAVKPSSVWTPNSRRAARFQGHSRLALAEKVSHESGCTGGT
jgi:FMN phosphatase YigB (HAD superfamily)